MVGQKSLAALNAFEGYSQAGAENNPNQAEHISLHIEAVLAQLQVIRLNFWLQH